MQTTDEPTVVMQRSRKAAYIVNPERYERDKAELSALRRAVFLAEVREMEAEYQAGEARQSSMLRAALRRFAVDPEDALLRTHKLKGDLDGYWAFSVDDDLRVLFRWDGDEAFLVNPGSHDQVY